MRKQDEIGMKIHSKPTHPGALTRERATVGVAEAMRKLVRPGDPLLDERRLFVIWNLGACGWDGMVCLVGIRCGGSDVGDNIRDSGWACVAWGGSDFVTLGLIGDGGVTGDRKSVV